MQRQSRRCLLAISFLILAVPVPLRAQADRGNPSSNIAPGVAPSRLVMPPFTQWIPPPHTFPRPLPVPPGTIALTQITRAAGTIFSGRVLSIARVPASGGPSLETVAITFHVERGLRGTTAGQDLTIFQWLGLWASGQRYLAGERVLLFLYPRNKLGLTSCVGGPMGRFSVDALGHVVLSQQHLAAFGADPVLGGKSRVDFGDFARAVQRASGE